MIHTSSTENGIQHGCDLLFTRLQGFLIDLGFDGAVLHERGNPFIDQLRQFCPRPLFPLRVVGFCNSVRIIDLVLNLPHMVRFVFHCRFHVHGVRDCHCATTEIICS